MLTVHQQKLWEAYVLAESRMVRSEKLTTLDTFLNALEESPPGEWYPWARSLAEQVVDHQLDLVIREPLLKRAVFPALLAGYQAQLPGCARWLAGLARYWQHRAEFRLQLSPDEPTELNLLREAVRLDPHDSQSRRRVLEKVADILDFSIHEVPYGVLYSMNGATPDQCLEMSAELDAFERHAEAEGMTALYANLIQKCRQHFHGYREYLLNQCRYESYEAYLRSMGIVGPLH